MATGESIISELNSSIEKLYDDFRDTRNKNIELSAQLAGCTTLFKSNQDELASSEVAREAAEEKHRDLTQVYEEHRKMYDDLKRENVRLSAPKFQPPRSHEHHTRSQSVDASP